MIDDLAYNTDGFYSCHFQVLASDLSVINTGQGTDSAGNGNTGRMLVYGNIYI